MRIRTFLSSLLVIALISPGLAFACSAFVLKGNTYTVIGFNENGPYLPGMVVVNKRGIRKHNLSWSRMVAAQPGKPDLTWTSQYGSVTTTVMGLDLPCYGMNERGLFSSSWRSRIPTRSRTWHARICFGDNGSNTSSITTPPYRRSSSMSRAAP